MVSISKVGRIFSTCFSRHCVGFSLLLGLEPINSTFILYTTTYRCSCGQEPRNLPVAQLELLWYDECCIRI